ncbi:MAG: YceI family protein [Bacteroidota bacterium]
MKTNLVSAFFVMLTLAFFSTGCTSSKTTSKVNEFDLGAGPLGTVAFEASNNRYSANGTFKNWNFSEFSMQGNDLTTLDATINVDMTSIEEKSPKLTDHLKAWDYFDVAKFPTGNIRIKDVKSKGGNAYEATAIISIKDLEKETTVEFELTNSNPMRVQGTLAINRAYFKIGEDNKGVTADVPVTFDTALPLASK